jgi:hypothetical protein
MKRFMVFMSLRREFSARVKVEGAQTATLAVSL